MKRVITVGYDHSRDDGDCVELTVLGGDPDDRFLVPFAEVESVIETMRAVVADGGIE